MTTFEPDVVDEALRTICTPCREGRHAECEPVPCSADEDCKYKDCRCPCPGDKLGIAAEHLRSAARAVDAGRLEEAKKHTAAAAELLGVPTPAPRRIRSGLAIVRVPGRYYEGAHEHPTPAEIEESRIGVKR